jgi:energy-coupling factor transport system substrate-specific component
VQFAEKYPLKPDQVRTCGGRVHKLKETCCFSTNTFCNNTFPKMQISSRLKPIIEDKMKVKLSLGENVFIAVMSAALGIAWWAYSFIYDFIAPFLKTVGLSGLLEGFWYMGGVFFGYIIRKPGSALLGEVIAATVEGLISQWGFSAVVSGVCQGLPVELLFFICRYKSWNKLTCALAGSLSALGGYTITYYWYDYSTFNLKFNLLNLGCNLISGAILGGLFSRFLANKLAKAGVLNQYRISHEQ